MAQGKKSFQMYTEWIEVFNELDNEEAGQLIKHIFKYVNDENPVAENKLVALSFVQIKQQLKRDLKKWITKSETNKANGALGGRPKNPIEPKITERLISEPKKPVEDKVEDKVKEKEKEQWFIGWFNSSMTSLKGSGKYKLNAKVKKQLHARIKEGYKSEDFKHAFEAISKDQYHKDKGYKFLTPEFITRTDKLELWSNAEIQKLEEEKGKGKGGVSMEELYNS